MNPLAHIGLVAILGLTVLAPPALADGEGEKVFKKFCLVCHATEAGKNKLGPSLNAIVGRKAGTVAGFKYSDANQNSGVVWDATNLNTYLEDPKAFMPGNKMTFAGVKRAEERKELVEYLTKLK